LESLSKLETWKVCAEYPDVRGWKLVDDTGSSLGIIRDLVVNTETEEVERIVLDSRAEYPVTDLEVTGEVVRVRRDEFMTESSTAPHPSHALRIRCSPG
jgi:sporulation protein YlmC with PRC-barrel domain